MHPLTSTRGARAAAIALALVASAANAPAAIFVVDNTSDPTVGTCDLAGACTLRQAIIESVATEGRDTITFDPAVFPPGKPEIIFVESPLPTIADPAGTVVDGTGAGVIVRSQITSGEDDGAGGLVFASAAGAPLGPVTVANLKVQEFETPGVVICGGLPPECDEDLAAPVVERVVSVSNGSTGIVIGGRNVTKARISDAVAAGNDGLGIAVHADDALAGARIERCTVTDNGFVGMWVGIFADIASDILITGFVAARNEVGLAVSAEEQILKNKFTNLSVSGNDGPGIYVEAPGLSALSASGVVSSSNDGAGITITADTMTATVLKDVVTNGNESGIMMQGEIVGAKILDATAMGNVLAGISVREAHGVKITRATVVGNGTQGVLLGGTGNIVKQVRASENADAGILLRAPGSGNKIEKCSGTANQGPGISVLAGNTANTVQNNVALGNDAIDLYDGNASCDADVWKKNVFENRNLPCIH
jgi:hypothetical protein